MSNDAKVIELDSQNAGSHFNRGNIYCDLKDYPKAILEFTKVIELNSQYADAYYNRGHVYQELKDYTKAITDYMKTIQLNSSYSLAIVSYLVEISNALYRGEEYVSAISCLNKAIEIDSRCKKALELRAKVYRVIGELKKAEEDESKVQSFNCPVK